MKTPRENLLSILRRQGLDHAAVQFNLCPSQVAHFHEKYGKDADYQAIFEFPWRFLGQNFQKALCTDWSKFFPGKTFKPGTFFDSFGVGHEPTPESMHMSRMHHPMEHFTSLEEFKSYPYPEFDPSQMEPAREAVRKLHAEGLAAGGALGSPVWETGWYMRGMENLMMDLISEEPSAVYHLDRLTELTCRRAEAFAEADCDLIYYGEDIGMQQTTMFSLEQYRDWLKPRLTAVCRAAKKVKPDLIVAYHSCGFVTPFIDDLIEAGIDVLNPVQPECMDFAEIHAKYGDRLSFWGTIGTQSTMPFGTPGEVRAAVLRNLGIAGKKGGLLCAPTHLVEPEVPWENIEAYAAAVKEFKP